MGIFKVVFKEYYHRNFCSNPANRQTSKQTNIQAGLITQRPPSIIGRSTS